MNTSRSTSKHLRDALLGVGCFGALLLLVELALRLFGAPLGPDPIQSRGFDPSAHYFVKSGTGDQPSWRPVFWDPANPMEGSVPVKGKRLRVLMFGGSNTKNFRSKPLEDDLNALAGANGNPLEGFEVINLARNGFGSSRVRIVFEQALELLQPDIVFIYSGHNEFVELGFQMDLDAQWSNPLMRKLADAVVPLRSFALLRSGLDLDATGKSGGAPREWSWEYDKFNHLTYAGTERYLEGYRANLDEMLTLAEAHDVKAVLSTVVYNRFAMPSSSVLPDGLDREARAEVAELETELQAALPDWLLPLFPAEGWQRVENFDWDRGWREGRAGAPLEFLDPAELWPGAFAIGDLAGADPRIPAKKYWNHPKVDQLVSCLTRLQGQQPSPDDRAALERVRQLADDVLALVPDHPKALFAKGIVADYLDRDLTAAATALEAAGSFDRAPRRGNAKINTIIRDVARAHPAALLLDADAAFANRHPTGLIGWKWMLDQCHLGFGARRLLMLLLSQSIIDRWYPNNP